MASRENRYLYVDIFAFSLFIFLYIYVIEPSLMAQMIKNLPAMQETLAQSPGQEDPLEKGMATHTSIFAWRILWTEELVDDSPWSGKESDVTER